MASDIAGGVTAATRIAAGDDRTHYDGVARTLHWLTAVLVLVQFGSGGALGLRARPTRHLMIVAHMSFGILLTAVIVVRIVWRADARASGPGGDVRLGRAGLEGRPLSAVYVLLAVQAVLGFVMRWAGNEAMSFFGLLIPPPFPPFSREAHHLVVPGA